MNENEQPELKRPSIIRISGLRRCCVDTLLERTEEDVEGKKMSCQHCGNGMIFNQGGWEWDRGAKP